MPYNQPATANYFGFMPVMVGGAQPRLTNYLVSSSCAAIYPGDAVGLSTVGIFVLPYLQASAPFVGIAASYVAANDGTTAADIRIPSTQTCLIWDDPGTFFVGCDTTSGVIGATRALGMVVDVLSTGCFGSTGNNTSLKRSVQALSGVTASSGTSLLPFKTMGLHPMESALSATASGTAAAATNVRKWILAPHHHAYALKTTST